MPSSGNNILMAAAQFSTAGKRRRSGDGVPQRSQTEPIDLTTSDDETVGGGRPTGVDLMVVPEDDEEAPPAKKACTAPLPPKTIAELNLTPPVYTMVIACGQTKPSQNYLEKVRRWVKDAIKENPDAMIVVMVPKYSPFLHMLKTTLGDLQSKLRARDQRQRGDTSRNLLSADEAGYYNRTTDEQTQHEDDTRRAASKPSYYYCHQVPVEHLPRLMRKDEKQVSDHKTLWQRKFGDWSRQYQHYIFKVMVIGMKGLVAIYGWELFSQFGDDQIRGLVGQVYDAAPLEHALAMWAKLASTLDVVGIFRTATHSVEEEARRERYRQSMRYRFVEICMLIWKYFINVDPDLIETYKYVAFEEWKEMTSEDMEYERVIGEDSQVGDVPVQATTDQTQNLVKSLFKLGWETKKKAKNGTGAASNA